MPRMQRFELSPNDPIKLLTRELLQEERLSILSKHTFALRIPLELDEDDHAHLKMEHLSCLRQLGEDLQIDPPYSTMGEPLLWASLHTPMITIRMASFKHMISSRWRILNLHFDHFFFLYYVDVLKVHMRYHSILFFKTHLPQAQLSHDQSLDHSLNILVIT